MDNATLIQQIQDFCEENEYTFYNDYSGRGMHGKQCVGIGADNIPETAMELLAYLCDIDRTVSGCDILDSLGNVQWDNMGLSHIIYFPSVITDR